MSACLLVCLFACLLVRLFACLLVCLFANMLVYCVVWKNVSSYFVSSIRVHHSLVHVYYQDVLVDANMLVYYVVWQMCHCIVLPLSYTYLCWFFDLMIDWASGWFLLCRSHAEETASWLCSRWMKISRACRKDLCSILYRKLSIAGVLLAYDVSLGSFFALLHHFRANRRGVLRHLSG